MFKVFIRILVVVALASFASPALPPNIRVCPRNSPRLAECFASSMESLKPYLKTGNFAPGFVTEGLEPLQFGDVSINRGFEMKLFNLQVIGASNFKVDKIRVSLSPIKVEMVLLIPKLIAKSAYTLNWKLGPLSLQGKGDASGVLEGAKIILKFAGSVYSRNRVDYIKVDNVKVNLAVAKTRVRFENLFNGQKALEDAANNVINQNTDLITREVFPQIERGFENFFLRGSNQFLEKGSFAEFFP